MTGATLTPVRLRDPARTGAFRNLEDSEYGPKSIGPAAVRKIAPEIEEDEGAY